MATDKVLCCANLYCDLCAPRVLAPAAAGSAICVTFCGLPSLLAICGSIPLGIVLTIIRISMRAPGAVAVPGAAAVPIRSTAFCGSAHCRANLDVSGRAWRIYSKVGYWLDKFSIEAVHRTSLANLEYWVTRDADSNTFGPLRTPRASCVAVNFVVVERVS